jgi:NADPH-dependent 2,4-dienoyl-CoA reductase/sulfur reductase-like enzyme/ferredoxin
VAADTTVPVEITPRSERPAFPNYTQLPVRVPITVWRIARFAVLAVGIGIIVLLFVEPDDGLTLFWRLAVPLLPIVWLALPGLWRNLCPLATTNQLPRLFGFTRGRTAPKQFTRFAYVAGISAFVVLVAARKVLFNRSGPATAVLLLTVLGLAFIGGILLKGKSGWCSTVCPLLPVQRLYGETPFLLVRNSHCEPCVGCAKNCFDFNPRVAKLTDLDDDDPRYAEPRRFFAALYPGLIVGFFTMPNLPDHSTAWVYGQLGLATAVSVTVFAAAKTFTAISDHLLTAVFAGAALNLFYWWSVPTLVDTLGRHPTGDARMGVIWLGRALVLGLTVPWLVRTYRKEAPYRAATSGAAVVAPAGLEALQGSGEPGVRFHPDGPEVAVAAGTPLLEVIENAELPIESGCRMGVCGADPVAILAGADCLSPPTRDEASTLSRLGLASSTRLACQAMVHGACTVALTPERADGPVDDGPAPDPGFDPDPAVRRLVVLGNGIAGSTAAEHARRLHPECEVHLVGLEPHRLYNRMAIPRLIYGRSAMQGLYLLPDDWHDQHHITSWLNTRARSIDLEGRTVALATGDELPYDRLVLALGSRSVVPEVPGIDLAGSFTLREADDAIAIRAYVQRHDVTTAVVAGGGLLGLETAYALQQVGVRVTVLERSPWLLRRQLDEPAARVVERYLEALGISILTDANVEEVVGDGRVEAVVLADGRRLGCELFLPCPGIAPNIELAREAGLEVGRGVVVDDHLRTSDPHVYAAGDVAEFGGRVDGLWPSSARQGEIAAVNAVGGDETYQPAPPTTLLKVVGIDVASIGRTEPSPSDTVLRDDRGDEARYRKVVVEDGRVVGAILVGHPRQVADFQAAVEEQRDLSDLFAADELVPSD